MTPTPAQAHAAALEQAVRSWFNMPPGADVSKVRAGLVTDAEAMIRAYLAALEQAGHKVVPREAEAGMIEASTAHRCILAEDHWLHMYDAAPAFTEGA